MDNTKKTILIVGSGGREHALGWKFRQSKHVGTIYFAPGNGGTDSVGENISIQSTDIENLITFAKEKHVDLTFVGPEVPLTLGIVDAFESNELRIFGPSKKGAQLEGSKVFASDFMKKYAIPHPLSEIFVSFADAKKYINTCDPKKIVIKASGLASGKGVILPQTKKQALTAIDEIMNKKIFGDAGREVVVQECLFGPEVSIIAFADGKTIVPLVASQDHKRVFDKDMGPNTGGMGAYAPAPFVDNHDMDIIQRDILEATIIGLAKEKIIYKGILYAGLMMTKTGPKVLEYNVRFGDPETQPLMMMLDCDIFELCNACLSHSLTFEMVKAKKGTALCVVLAAKGYPGSYTKSEEIKGLNTVDDPDIQVFHAGTVKQNDKIETSGGRVLGVTAYADIVKKAKQKVYSSIGPQGVHFKGMHYRKDIAWQAV